MRIASTKSLLNDPARAWAPFEPRPTRPWDLAACRPPAPPGRVRRPLGDPPARPAGRARGAASTGCSTASRRRGDGRPAAEFESLLDAMAAQLGPSAALDAAPGDLALPDDLHAAPAPRADDPVLAQPLRHLERQGPEHRADAAPERPAPRARPGRLPRPARRDRQGPGDADLARLDGQPQGPARTRTTPAR